jgi:hypothetical protein
MKRCPVPATTPAIERRCMSMRARPLTVSALACLLASGCIGDGDDGVALEEFDPEALEDPEVMAECEEELSGSPEERAVLELAVDSTEAPDGNGTEHAVRVYLGNCLIHTSPVGGGGSLGYGFRAGEYTLRIYVDGEEAVKQDLITEPGDIFLAGMNVEEPTKLYTALGTKLDAPADRWRTYIMNIGAPDLILSRVVDPGADEPEVEPLAALAQGETFSGELPVSAEHGVVLRSEQDGEVIWEDQIGPFGCAPGEFTGGLTIFWAFSATGPTSGGLYPNPDGEGDGYCDYPG